MAERRPGRRAAEDRHRAGCTRDLGDARPAASAGSRPSITRQIGMRYIVTAFVFLVLGGIEALVDAAPARAARTSELLTPEQYDQLFTMHGMTMIFLYALPVLSGFSNYLWPLLLGSRDMAFPRLNALSYWVYLVAGIFLYVELPARARRRTTAGSTTCPTPARQYNPGPQHRRLCARA